MYTFISPVKWSTLRGATDSNHTDNVVLGGVEVCYQHLRVRFRYYDLLLLPTWTQKQGGDRGATVSPHNQIPA